MTPAPNPSGPYSGHDAVLEQAARWKAENTGVALATVVATWGSSPRPVGSLLAVAGDGRLTGSVSGGCIEGAVVTEALDVIETGHHKLLDFGVSDDDAWQAGLTCGGQVRILVEKIGPAGNAGRFAQLLDDRSHKRMVVLATNLKSGHQKLIYPFEHNEDSSVSADLLSAASQAALADRGRIVETPDGDIFLNVFNPPLRMIIVGAVHISQPLSVMAREAGYQVTVVDPRRAFATPERFPDMDLRIEWPDEALQSLGLDHRTAVVSLTHDPKLDDPALVEAVNSEAFYIGALGSNKNHGKRVARLRERDIPDALIARIHGPIGLDIGAKSPSEIAVSILAEVTQALRRPPSQPQPA